MVKKLSRSLALISALAIFSSNIVYAETVTQVSPVVESTTQSIGVQVGNDYTQGPGTVGVFATESSTDTSSQPTVSNTSQTTGNSPENPINIDTGSTSSNAGATQDNSAGGSTTNTEIGPGVGTGSAQNGNQASGQSSIAQPELASEAAALYDAATGQFLFEKNGSQKMYPASTTKLMTALLTAENLSLSDTVTYSAKATQNLESGAATVNLTTGDTLSVKDSLYALLLKSACEVANGLGEKVSGSEAAFAELMNSRAKALGCTGTHFTNASGLNDDNHYTTAKDMALIANAAVSNATLAEILKTKSYQLPASKKRQAITITNGNKMINSANTQYYEGIVGGKTGYTSKAGNTLCEVADINGHRLVAVVMKSKSKHYEDVTKLFDYGKELLGSGTQSSTANGVGPGASSVPNSDNAGTTSGTTTGTPGSSSTATAPGTSTNAGFVKTDKGYMYLKSDGSYCKNEWLDLNSKSYFFDQNGIMATGWKTFTNGSSYYFNPEDGSMVKSKWITDSEKGKSYYVGADGVMAKSTVIDGTYRVNENGEYVEKIS